MNFCYSIPNRAYIVIQFNANTQDCYVCNSFYINSNKELHVSFLAQMLSLSSFVVGTKHRSLLQLRSRKRVAAICRNWNLRICILSLCSGGYCHNVCCECYGNYKARDIKECFKKLNLQYQ